MAREKREDNTDGGATQMPQDQLTKPSAAESTEDQARDTAQPTSNDQQVPLPPPPGRQQFLRAASCHHQPERSNSMTSKLVSSLSMRVSNGMPGRQFSRREDKPWSKDKKLKPEDSIWKKTIILGEKCRVRDDDEDNILYDEKGNKIATFHQKPQTAAMSFSRHTTVPTFTSFRNSSRLDPRNNITKPGGHGVIVTDALIHDLCPQSRNPDFCQYILSQFKGQPLFPKLLASLVGTTVIQAKTTTTKIWRLQMAIKDDRSELKLRTRNPSICLNTLDSLRGSRLFPKPLVVLGMNPMSMAQSHANRTATSIWDLYRSTANRMFKLRRRYYNCVLNYVDAMKQLNKAKKLMLAGEARSVKNYTLLAVDRVDSCDVELVKPLISEANRKFLQANMKFKDLCDIILEIFLTSSINGSTSAQNNGTVTDELVRGICNRTRNPSLCLNNLKSLKGKSLQPNPVAALGRNSMYMVQSRANRTVALTWAHYRGTTVHKPEVRMKYYKCFLKYTDIMKQLGQANQYMLAGAPESVKDYVLVSVNQVNACNQELLRPPRERSDVLEANVKFKIFAVSSICNKVHHDSMLKVPSWK
ncbi:UNVERIFIED_CONTAM: Pectinesterase inhibitor [Sesamum calycinum]|uniref:Pectinesterase inhibitor n=1 Tax=Sesamum calycinum TaxID=2727403 RepID=A0AAW2LX44_9LAMI